MSQLADDNPVSEVGSQVRDISTLNEFWSHFKLFPLPFDELCFNYWGIFLLSFILLILILDFILDRYIGIDMRFFLNILREGGHFKHVLSLLGFDLTDWILILEGVAICLIGYTFKRWLYSIQAALRSIPNKKCFQPVNGNINIEDEYLIFLKEYQEKLLSKKRYVLIFSIVILALLFVSLALLRIPGIINSFQHYPGVSNTYIMFYLFRWILLVLFANVFLSYLCGVGAWEMIVTGSYIRKLTSKFKLTIQPSHPDKCGGLRFLSAFCLTMVLPLLIGTFLLGVYGIGLTIQHGITLFTVASSVGLFLIALPLLFSASINPLWNFHKAMVCNREVYEDEYSQYISAIENVVRDFLNKGMFKDAADASKEKNEIEQGLHPDKIKYPVWPFRFPILFTLLISQLIPVISIIFQYITLVKK